MLLLQCFFVGLFPILPLFSDQTPDSSGDFFPSDVEATWDSDTRPNGPG